MDADFPAIADALLRVSLQSASRTATPSKAATAAAATAALAYSSPLTDPQPPTKSTGAAASAAAFGEPIQPPPPPPLSKRLTRSQGPARVDAAAAAELRAQLDRERAERARAQALMRTALVTRLHGAGADIYETLKMEWVLQAECTGSERQMGMAFTARLKAARLNFDDLPESRGWGVYELGALQRVLTGDASLQAEVVAPSIAKWKDAQTQVLCGMAPFNTVEARPDETLMAYMTRCQNELVERCDVLANPVQMGRPRKKTAADLELRVRKAKEGTRYTAQFRLLSYKVQMYSANRVVSLRGTKQLMVDGAMALVEGLDPSLLQIPCPQTRRLHAMDVHLVQRQKAVEFGFAVAPSYLQHDEITILGQAWCGVSLSTRRPDGTRLRERIKAAKLAPDETTDKVKTGPNLGINALYGGMTEIGAPVKNVHYVTCDMTNSNSGQGNPNEKDSGGAIAHYRQRVYETTGHFLIFATGCPSHAADNAP